MSKFRFPLSPLVFIGVLISGLLLSGCGGDKSSGPRARAAAPVREGLAEKVDLNVTQESVGNVQAFKTVAVRSRVDGMIEKAHFKEGDRVNEGDLLVTIDKKPFEAKLAIARAELNTARAEADQAAAEAERYRKLDQQQVVSKEQFAQLVTRAEVTKAVVEAKLAAVDSAQLDLGYTEIRAPMAGRTGQLMLHEGSLVRANDTQAMVVINQLEPTYVAYSIPENILPSVKRALKREDGHVKVKVFGSDRESEFTEEGELVFVDNEVDTTTGMVMLKAQFQNKERRLWPGQFVRVATELEVEKGVVIVQNSVVQAGQTGLIAFVLKKDEKGNDLVELREVKTGKTVGEQVVILSGIEGGERVVTDGQLRLVDGARVQVLSDTPKTNLDAEIVVERRTE